jgi:predicted nuclease with RNAse H fold
MREIRLSGLTRGRVMPSLLYGLRSLVENGIHPFDRAGDG